MMMMMMIIIIIILGDFSQTGGQCIETNLYFRCRGITVKTQGPGMMNKDKESDCDFN